MDSIIPQNSSLSMMSTSNLIEAHDLFASQVEKKPKPKAIEPQFNDIPEELRKYGQWVLWKYVLKGEKWTKVPFNARSLTPASSNDPATFSTFVQVITVYRTNPGKFDGVGFVFTDNDPFIGLDLDKCVKEIDYELSIENTKDGVLPVRKLIDSFNSYTELSPSGTGIHIILKGDVSDCYKSDSRGVEIYKNKRYFCFTGSILDDEIKPIADRTDYLNKFIAWLKARDEEKKASEKPQVITNNAIEEQSLNYLKDWSSLRRELGNRIINHSTARKNASGKYDCRGICHNGEGNTGLFYDPAKNQAVCNKKCDQAAILKAFGLPTSPIKTASNSPKLSSDSFPLDPVLEKILQSLQPVSFKDMAGVKSEDRLTQKDQIVVTIDEVLRVAKALDCGLAKQNDFIYVFNSNYWREINKEELTSFLGKAAEKLGVNQTTAKFYLFRDSLLKQFLTSGYLPQPKREDGVTLINLQNGTFEINGSGQNLRLFKREDFLTYQLPFAYEPDAQCPMWLTFLNEVLPDVSRQNVLAEFIGYCFTDLKLEKVLLPYGSGANGKSVFFDVMTALFGEENISHYGLYHLTEEHNRAMIANKLLNYSSEISTRLESEVFKQMASGEPIHARLKYGNPFILKRYAKLAFNCNELPRDIEFNNAYFRRFLIVPFDVTIPEEKQDKDLARRIIKSELSGVFNWVLAGLNRLLQEKRFTESQAVKDTLASYRRESDSVAVFLDEEGYGKPDLIEDGYTIVQELYHLYKPYCLDNGYKPLGRNNFIKRLESLGHKTDKKESGKVVFLSKKR